MACINKIAIVIATLLLVIMVLNTDTICNTNVLPEHAKKMYAKDWNIAIVKVKDVKSVSIIRPDLFYNIFQIHLYFTFDYYIVTYNRMAVVEVERLLRDKDDFFKNYMKNGEIKLLYNKKERNCNYTIGDRKIIFTPGYIRLSKKVGADCYIDCIVRKDNIVECNINGEHPVTERFELDLFIEEVMKNDAI